jgi:hypothetical protein
MNREILYNIYQRCVDQVWIDFFDTNENNIIFGSRHLWQPPYFRDASINDSADSFALVFNLPFSSKTALEVYCNNDASRRFFIDDLLKVLAKRGVGYAKITLPGCNVKCSTWFEEKGMITYNFVAMSKTL